ncbi:MAG TPA: hypothetical protein PLW93_05690 [Candidatus Absconditabacterales bacterium]|nr:hypothetical protein [Candidatus Absconditabacterales bacterium]
MNNSTKTIILLLILGAVVLLISGCSNFDTMTDQKIKELEAEKQKAQVACDQVQIMQKKIDGLLAYKGNNPTNNGTSEIKQEPTVAPSVGYICLVDDKGNTEYREYKDNEVEYLKDCGAFLNKPECWIAPDGSNCLKKE